MSAGENRTKMRVNYSKLKNQILINKAFLIKLIVLIIILPMMFYCSLTWWGQAKTYAEKNRGQRPDVVLDGVRDGRLVVGMNEKEANYVVWYSHQGRVSWDSFTTRTEIYRVKTMWNDAGTRFIQLHFKDGYLESWSRHS